MKKTKRISSFLAGAAAALTLSACLTTAIAAADKVTYNFANVALDGSQKITAGQDITAAARHPLTRGVGERRSLYEILHFVLESTGCRETFGRPEISGF